MTKRKDFKNWSLEKEIIQEKAFEAFFDQREVWWCKMGVNIGSEQDGGGYFCRPALILKKFSKNLCLIIPISGQEKTGIYYIDIGQVLEQKSFAIISQIRLIDTKRLENKAGIVDELKFQEIRNAVTKMILDI